MIRSSCWFAHSTGERGEVDGQQAEAAGLAPASGCRMGICHTCTRSLTCGTVRDVVIGDATSAEPTAGAGVDIRICVSTPVTDTAIDL